MGKEGKSIWYKINKQKRKQKRKEKKKKRKERKHGCGGWVKEWKGEEWERNEKSSNSADKGVPNRNMADLIIH